MILGTLKMEFQDLKNTKIIIEFKRLFLDIQVRDFDVQVN